MNGKGNGGRGSWNVGLSGNELSLLCANKSTEIQVIPSESSMKSSVHTAGGGEQGCCLSHRDLGSICDRERVEFVFLYLSDFQSVLERRHVCSDLCECPSVLFGWIVVLNFWTHFPVDCLNTSLDLFGHQTHFLFTHSKLPQGGWLRVVFVCLLPTHMYSIVYPDKVTSPHFHSSSYSTISAFILHPLQSEPLFP